MDIQRVHSGDMPTRVGPVEYVYIDGTIQRYVSYFAWKTDPAFKVEMDDPRYNNWEMDYYLPEVDERLSCKNLDLDKVEDDKEKLKNEEEVAETKRLLHECIAKNKTKNKAKNKTKVSPEQKVRKYVFRHRREKDRSPKIENKTEFPDIGAALSKRKTRRLEPENQSKAKKWRPRQKRFSWN